MVEPHKHLAIAPLANYLDTLQKVVSIGADYQGLLVLLRSEDGACILCDEEGKLIGLEGNRRLGRDVIVGDFYVVGEEMAVVILFPCPKMRLKIIKNGLAASVRKVLETTSF